MPPTVAWLPVAVHLPQLAPARGPRVRDRSRPAAAAPYRADRHVLDELVSSSCLRRVALWLTATELAVARIEHDRELAACAG